MPLEPNDRKRLIAAVGYLELGMPVEASRELGHIGAGLRQLPEVLNLRLEICRQDKSWDLMEVVARHLVHAFPGNAGYWVDWAYSSRRSESLKAARLILLQALKLHPIEAIILYNLACYECQLGDIQASQEYLREAIRIDPSYRLTAQGDPDLDPLSSSMGEAN